MPIQILFQIHAANLLKNKNFEWKSTSKYAYLADAPLKPPP